MAGVWLTAGFSLIVNSISCFSCWLGVLRPHSPSTKVDHGDCHWNRGVDGGGDPGSGRATNIFSLLNYHDAIPPGRLSFHLLLGVSSKSVPELHGLQGRHNLVYAVLSTSFPYFASQLQPAFMAPIRIFLAVLYTPPPKSGDSRGFPWIPVDSHGFLWIPCGFPVPEESPWIPVDSVGILWNPWRFPADSQWNPQRVHRDSLRSPWRIPRESTGILVESTGIPRIPVDSESLGNPVDSLGILHGLLRESLWTLCGFHWESAGNLHGFHRIPMESTGSPQDSIGIP
ncbi:hypothetical protein BD779DRAFT_1472535 [Infundibulicybe gibba]|nr:hypothetical protein BD779DRAFT_1472535 [Infundibulicybe gibba]